MTKPSGIPPAAVPCKDCGTLIERKYGGRGQPPQRCDSCRRAHLRTYDRERHRRIAVAHREPCPRCGGELEDRRKRRTPYCAACYSIVRRERQNEKDRALRRARGRRCRECGAEIPFNGKRTPRRCDSCRYQRQKSLIRANQWGISREQYDAMLLAQDRCCAICRSGNPGKRGWAVDHDHTCCPGNSSCGICVRGLLCTRCNMLLGCAQDDTEILARATAYLRSPPVLK